MLRARFIHDWRRKLNSYSGYRGTLRDFGGKLKKPLELDVTYAVGRHAFSVAERLQLWERTIAILLPRRQIGRTKALKNRLNPSAPPRTWVQRQNRRKIPRVMTIWCAEPVRRRFQ